MNYNKFNPYSNSNLEWIIVQNVEQVETIAVQPNQKAWIMVQNQPVFALRSADSMGLVKTELYKFEKYEPPKAEYVTAEQLKAILAEFKEGLTYEPVIEPTEQPKTNKRKTDNPIATNG